MFDKLLGIEERFESVNEQLCDPATVSDQQLYTKLMKELKQLTPVVEKFREYKSAQTTRDDAKEMKDDSSLESELREMAEEEFLAASESCVKLLDELKILLLPKDPNDDKSFLVMNP